MITRSYCSSWTRSIILQSMQDLRSNPQGAGNPNIPRSCTALLQSSQSAAPGTSVYHTHASPSLSKRCERFRSLPVGGGGGGKLLPLPVGATQHAHPTNNRGSQCRVRKGSTTAVKKIKPSQTKRGELGKTKQKKIDWHRKLSWKSQWKCNLDFHFKRFEVSGTHLFICNPVWPRQTEIILRLNIRRNSPFLYLEIPIKRGSCLLVSYYIFFFSP